MTKDEALKLALEALNNLAAWNDGEVGGHMDEPYSAEVARRTITVIKEALAQQEQECKSPEPKARRPDVHCPDKTCGFLGECRLGYKPEQEPVGWLDSNDKLAEFMHKDLKAEHDKRDSSTPRAFQIPVYTKEQL